MAKKESLGEFLKRARVELGLSQGDVANYLGLRSAQSVSDWERGYGAGVPVPSLKKLVKLYKLDSKKVFQLFLDYQTSKLQVQLRKEYFGSAKGNH